MLHLYVFAGINLVLVDLQSTRKMFVKVTKRDPLPPDALDVLIKAGTVDRTILASDLGQKGIDHPVVGFRNVIKVCIGLGYSDEDIRKMISGNPLRLLGLESQ